MVDGRDGGESPFAGAPSSNMNFSFFFSAGFLNYMNIILFLSY